MGENGPEGTDSGTKNHRDMNLAATALSVDAILSLLADHQRRDLLRHLIESPEQTATLEECVQHILQREEERTGQCPGHEQVETALHHIHLPKLEQTNILEYDSRSQVLRYRGHERLEAWLDRIEAGESDEAE